VIKRRAGLAISLAFAALILDAVLRKFDVRRTTEFVRQAHPNLLVLGCGLMVAAYLLRGARWLVWERSLSYWNSLRLILIGSMGNNVLPARLGEILRAHCSAAKTSDDRGRTTALASITAERILDGVILGVFGLVAMCVVAVDPRLQRFLFLVSLAFTSLTLGPFFCIRSHEHFRSFVSALSRKLPGRSAAFAREKAIQLIDGILPLGTFPRGFAAITTTALIWSIEVGFYYCVGLAVWGGMTMPIALLFVVVVNFASLIPLTMGRIGTIEAIAPLFLISSDVTPNLALAMVQLQHAAQYFFTTTSGGLLYLLGGFHRISLTQPKAVAP
jgi:glycosyltransferase 2 family protein